MIRTYFNEEEVNVLEITINIRQAIALVWTFIAIVIALIVDLALGFPSSLGGGVFAGAPWWFVVVAFFGIFLVITLPVYLLLALWGLMATRDNE